MATVTPGYTFQDTETVTAAKLALLASGTVTGVGQGDVGSGNSLVITSATPPTAATGVAWFDTSQGAGRGILRIYDNGVWRPVAEGFIGYNNGLTVARGAPVVYDTSFSSGVTVGTVPFRRTSIPTSGAVQMERPIGVAGESIVNAATGIILTQGYATAIKDGSNITAGDPCVPSITTAAQCTTGALGSWGYPEGSACFGRWMDTSAAASGTEVAVWLTGHVGGSWFAFKNAPATIVNGTPTAGAWTDTSALSVAPIGTVARVCQMQLAKSVTNGILLMGLRMKNATVDINTGASMVSSGATLTAGANDYNVMRAQVIVPETTAASTNLMQYWVSGSDTTNLTLKIYEVGVIVGGQVV